jgi:actin-like ATPase involved in cell morphogenesis
VPFTQSLPSSTSFLLTSRMAGEGGCQAIGIDLGTTYSCVAAWKDGRVEIILNDQGNRTTPSYVAFTDKKRLVGDAAKNQVARNPTNSVFGNLPHPFVFFFFLGNT